ncbi:hypothetical protein [Moritella sp. 28]|uniref:hypothetical protein n=1 Tax=Moritella sp. 28 TaxID=2746232 RepID=UPI001BA7B5CE|nr:hypothetical protein [Moritella sp. 28]QUM86327.1 hypothetical protein HWV02_18350 [Moritella sp. 28]
MKSSDNFKLIWWFLLVIALGLYLFFRQDDLLKGKPTYFDTVVFLVWISVCLSPLFKEMKIFGLHLKQDIEDLKKELNQQLSLMKIELKSSIEVSSSNSNHVHINGKSPIPAADSDIPDIKKHVAEALNEYGVKPLSTSDNFSFVENQISTENMELFKVRYAFEKLLNDHVNIVASTQRKQPMTRLLKILTNDGVISSNLTNSILEIIAICNHATHGADITANQRQLVNESAQGLYEALQISLVSNI